MAYTMPQRCIKPPRITNVLCLYANSYLRSNVSPRNNICIVHVVVPKLIIILFHLYPFNKKASPLPSIRDPTYVKNFSKQYKKKYRQQVDNSFTRITTTIVFFFEFSVSWNVKSRKKKKKRMKSKGGKKNIRKFLANQFHDTRIYTRAPEILKNISEETKAQRGEVGWKIETIATRG